MRTVVACAFALGVLSGCITDPIPGFPGDQDQDPITGNPGNGNTGGGNTGGGNTGGGNTGGGNTGGGDTGGNPGGGNTGGGDTGGNPGGGVTDPGDDFPGFPGDGDGDWDDDPIPGGDGDGDGDEDPGPVDPGPSAPHCMDGITNYKQKGPFKFTKKRSGKVNLWVPQVPAGCKVPVVHLANGTTATCSVYGAILEHLASHGFLATCYEDPNTGQGTQCIEALETAYREYPNLADDKIGSTGHSQGGGAAVVCTYRAEQKWGNSKIYAGHAMEPAHGFGDAPRDYASLYRQIKSPIFMFNGSVDVLVAASWVRQGFNALDKNTEAYWYEAVGAAHIPVPTRWTQESATVWFRWKLLGDKQACQYFKNMPNTSDWNKKDVRNPKDC